ncbi:histone methyltransferase set1 [Tilletia horrida]|uniref:Histone-lysine N-methyltransferase, H3 lysine-4 specific n=1 Tax=Tilletia horrida TaxID=155126 RepID=A0AAN6JTE3_9BASI|nr:histone methyltransferase set1 [Tilletia horrida]KAK0553962.1 histone methyltransferase set1 [Tilletia horrida]KAK0565347.1 histone methyltransferase set1 [Tilletia horrida]
MGDAAGGGASAGGVATVKLAGNPMTITSNIKDEIRSVVDTITEERRKNDEWEAAFDRHLKHNKSKRVVTSRRSASSTASTSAATILGHIEDASAATTGLRRKSSHGRLSETSASGSKLNAPTEPSLLTRLGGLKVLPRKKTSPEHSTSLSERTEGSSKDHELLSTSLPNSASLPPRPSLATTLHAEHNTNTVAREKDSWVKGEELESPASHRGRERSNSRSASAHHPHSSHRHHDYEDEEDYDHHRRSSSSSYLNRDHSYHPYRRETRSREDDYSGSSTAAKAAHRKGRDVWEAPSHRRPSSSSRTDTYIPTSSPLVAHPDTFVPSPSTSASHSKDYKTQAAPSMEDDRESLVSSSHQHRTPRTSQRAPPPVVAYGGPLPSPPHTSSTTSQNTGSAPPVEGASGSDVRDGGIKSESREEQLPPSPPPPPFPLPHELPFDPSDRNYIAWPPPSVAAALGLVSKDGKSKEAVVRFAPRPDADGSVEIAPVKDPRLKLIADGKYGLRGRKKVVSHFKTFQWERDANSVGVLPPTAVAVSGWDLDTSFATVLKYFQSYGRIEETVTDLDKDLGTRMPFAWIGFAHEYDGRGQIRSDINVIPGRTPQDATKIVAKVIKDLNGLKLPPSRVGQSGGGVLVVQADRDKKKYWAAYNAELHRRRLERAGHAMPAPVAHSAAASSALSPIAARHGPPSGLAASSKGGGWARVNGYGPPPTGAATQHHQDGGNAMSSPLSTRGDFGTAAAVGQPSTSSLAASAQLAADGTPWGASMPPTGPSEWRARANGTAAPVSRPSMGNAVPVGAPTGPSSQQPRWSSGHTLPAKPKMMGREDGFTAGAGAGAGTGPEQRAGRFGGAPTPTGPGAGFVTDTLSTETIMSRLALLGRPYFRFAKPYRKLRFSDIKASFHGNANIDLLEQDDRYFYCCLKSESLTMHHHRTPVRHIRNGDRIKLELCPAPDPHLYPATAQSFAGGVAPVHEKAEFDRMADALISSAKEHADSGLHSDQQQSPEVKRSAPVVVDAMAVLAKNSASLNSASRAAVPLPSIRRREYIPAEELDEDDLPPAKIRKVSHHRGAANGRDAAPLRGASSESQRGKGSSPLPPTQGTPTESTRMDDSDDEGVGIKDDETQTTAELEDDEERKAIFDMRPNGAGSRGTKRRLKIFSSDEEDGAESEQEKDDDDDDDDSSVSHAVLAYKSPVKKARLSAEKRESDDLLASMLLDTVTNSVPVHDVALGDLLQTVNNGPAANGAARKPPKAAAKADKKAKLAGAAVVPAPAAKKGKGGKKGKAKPTAIVTIPPSDPEPQLAIIVTEPETPSTESIPPTPVDAVGLIPSKAAKKSDPRTKKGRRERARSPSPDPFALNFAENAEDLYFLRLACERIRDGLGVSDEDLYDMEEETGLPSHSSGSARTEGYYKIPASQKAAHLPDRNKAIVEETTASSRTIGTARGNRAESRRVLLNIELHKKESASDTDILKFNQLSARKKHLKFAKSPIHDWGLYAMEQIPAGDMVIEYVGEVIRQQVADEREKRYERQGQFSTYLFRVDDELVVDATMKGNIARLMNHCCTPNCTAKILTVNGEKRIALFAKSTILKGQELTYDYKFQSSGEDADQISCLCGSANCRKFL